MQHLSLLQSLLDFILARLFNRKICFLLLSMPDRSSGWRQCLGKGHGGQPLLRSGFLGLTSSWDISPSSDSRWEEDELSGSHKEKV